MDNYIDASFFGRKHNATTLDARDIYNKLINIESVLLNIHVLLHAALNQPQDEEDSTPKVM